MKKAKSFLSRVQFAFILSKNLKVNKQNSARVTKKETNLQRSMSNQGVLQKPTKNSSQAR
jgi:hypothetical protein